MLIKTAGPLLLYFSVICGVFLQGIFPHLDADEADALVGSGGELTSSLRGHTQPVTGSQLHRLAVNDGLSLARDNEVDFLIFLVVVHKGNTGSSGR